MVNKNQCLDTRETKSYGLDDNGGHIAFQGWDIKEPEKLILEELEEYYDYLEVQDLKIISKNELAFTCHRYENGEDAQDEGFSHWMTYKDVWRRGYGKATSFKIKYVLFDKDHIP